MPLIEPNERDQTCLAEAFAEARRGHDEGGVPVGAVMARDGEIVARGRNRLVQEGNPILHGETDCLRAYGRQGGFGRMTLYTSLSPCAMCAGAILLFGIPRVIVGENRNFAGEVDLLLSRGVAVGLVNDPEMIAFFAAFTRERADLWQEDIAGYEAG